MRRFIGLVIVISLLSGGALSASAQVLPSPREDLRALDQAYQTEVLREVQTTITAWHQAWAQRDTRALMRLYMPDALLLVPDASVPPLQGAAAIEAHLVENWGTVGTIQLGLSSAEASGRLVYISGRFFVNGGQALSSERVAALPQARSGTFVAVMQRQGRGWRILAQVFRPDGAVGE